MSLTHSRGGGSGREAVPALSDGMRAPPGTEADEVVELEGVVVEELDVVEEMDVVEEIDVVFPGFFSPSGC